MSDSLNILKKYTIKTTTKSNAQLWASYSFVYERYEGPQRVVGGQGFTWFRTNSDGILIQELMMEKVLSMAIKVRNEQDATEWVFSIFPQTFNPSNGSEIDLEIIKTEGGEFLVNVNNKQAKLIRTFSPSSWSCNII